MTHRLVAWRVTSRYSFAITSMSLKNFPFLYEITGGSLNISLSNGWFYNSDRFPKPLHP